MSNAPAMTATNLCSGLLHEGWAQMDQLLAVELCGGRFMSSPLNISVSGGLKSTPLSNLLSGRSKRSCCCHASEMEDMRLLRLDRAGLKFKLKPPNSGLILLQNSNWATSKIKGTTSLSMVEFRLTMERNKNKLFESFRPLKDMELHLGCKWQEDFINPIPKDQVALNDISESENTSAETEKEKIRVMRQVVDFSLNHNRLFGREGFTLNANGHYELFDPLAPASTSPLLFFGEGSPLSWRTIPYHSSSLTPMRELNVEVGKEAGPVHLSTSLHFPTCKARAKMNYRLYKGNRTFKEMFGFASSPASSPSPSPSSSSSSSPASTTFSQKNERLTEIVVSGGVEYDFAKDRGVPIGLGDLAVSFLTTVGRDTSSTSLIATSSSLSSSSSLASVPSCCCAEQDSPPQPSPSTLTDTASSSSSSSSSILPNAEQTEQFVIFSRRLSSASNDNQQQPQTNKEKRSFGLSYYRQFNKWTALGATLEAEAHQAIKHSSTSSSSSFSLFSHNGNFIQFSDPVLTLGAYRQLSENAQHFFRFKLDTKGQLTFGYSCRGNSGTEDPGSSSSSMTTRSSSSLIEQALSRVRLTLAVEMPVIKLVMALPAAEGRQTRLGLSLHLE
jgi:hypothetical protein